MPSTTPYIAEIRIFPYDYAPSGWAFCNGQLLPISQNTALFSMIGTVYGGNAQTVFALPDLRARAPMHPGHAPGLTERTLGESGGTDTVVLLQSEIPSHIHSLTASAAIGTTNDPQGMTVAVPMGGGNLYRATGSPVTMSASGMAPTGGNLPHNNMQPFLTLNFCIALVGEIAPRP